MCLSTLRPALEPLLLCLFVKEIGLASTGNRVFSVVTATYGTRELISSSSQHYGPSSLPQRVGNTGLNWLSLTHLSHSSTASTVDFALSERDDCDSTEKCLIIIWNAILNMIKYGKTSALLVIVLHKHLYLWIAFLHLVLCTWHKRENNIAKQCEKWIKAILKLSVITTFWTKGKTATALLHSDWSAGSGPWEMLLQHQYWAIKLTSWLGASNPLSDSSVLKKEKKKDGNRIQLVVLISWRRDGTFLKVTTD